MPVAYIVNNLRLVYQKLTTQAKQGAATSDFDTPFPITVTGNTHVASGSLSNNTAVTIYDDDDDAPTSWDYCHIVADGDYYVQVIGSATNATFKCLAKAPFTLSYKTGILAAANTTAISTSEPSVTAIDSILVGNYTGAAINWRAVFVD